MNALEQFKRYYKEAIIAGAAYEGVKEENKKLILAKYPQFKVLAHSTGNKISGMQAMLLQDEKGEIFLSIRKSYFMRHAG